MSLERPKSREKLPEISRGFTISSLARIFFETSLVQECNKTTKHQDDFTPEKQQCPINQTCIKSLLNFFRILELKDAFVRFWNLREVGTLLQRAGPR